ncbi:MAG: Xaa-Pro peptidase family protein [Candidatus Jordarchaeales archaeon]
MPEPGVLKRFCVKALKKTKVFTLHEQRLKSLRNVMNDLDAFLTTSSANIWYLTGFFPGFPSLLFVPKDGEVALLVSKADAAPAEEKCRFRIEVTGSEGFTGKLKEFIKPEFKKVGVEESLEAGTLSRLMKEFPTISFELFNGLRSIRSVKSPSEIKEIQKSVKIAEAGMKAAIESVNVGVRECDVAAEAEYEMRRLGAEAFPFDTIVASGKKAALPHATTSTKKIERGDVVVIDLGAKYRYYCSDITRTAIVGRNDKMEKVLRSVIRSQEAALSMVKPEVACNELDSAARKVLEADGYDKYFPHSLGHGIGLDVHELPSLNPTSRDKLKENMVFTVEPGVYIYGTGGVRVEDIVVVEKKRGKTLTRIPKEIFI